MSDATPREALRAEHQDAKGPGKYEGNRFPLVASYIHDSSLHSCQQREVGTIEYGPGWYGYFRLDPSEQRDVLWLMDEEHELGVEPPVVAILHEDDRGFVTVTLYIDEDEAEAAWNHAEGEYAVIDLLDDDECPHCTCEHKSHAGDDFCPYCPCNGTGG